MNVDTMATLFALLTIAADVAVVVIVVLAVAGRNGSSARDTVWETLGPSAIWLAFLVALTATLGSLYLSEVAHFIPCKLCWYQRIAMYPLVPILAIAAWKRDAGIWRYAVPVAAIGAVISIYHYQLERFPSQASVSCSAEAPCTVVWIWKFHFISIPFMALSGFALIVTLLLVARSTARLDTNDEGATLTEHSGATVAP
jgi:disulfide bond formation protein DsbB